MFATLSNGKITHYRGDTFREPLYIYEGNKLNFTDYQLEENDLIYFAIMEPHQAFEDAIVKKKYDINSEKDSVGNIIIDLKSIDTQYLLPGTYYYEVKIRKNAQDENESIETIITPTIWWMLGDIPNKTTEVCQ